MDTIEIFVKSRDVSLIRKKLLLELCSNKKISVNNIFRKDNGFTLVLLNHSEAEKLFDVSIMSVLSTNRFEPILSNKLKSYRTILAKRIDRSTLESSPDSIKTEINTVNRDKIEATDVFRIPNSSILKITLKTSAMADIVLNEGFSMFFIHISPYMLHREDYIELINCFNCYAIDEHLKKDCPKEPKIICSICASDHFYRQCTASPDQYRCINCGGRHKTLHNSCPLRKARIKHIRNQRTNGDSYANVARRPHQVTVRPSAYNGISQTNPRNVHQNIPGHIPLNLSQTGLNPDVWNKTTAIIQMALVSNLVNPGTFSTTYNDLCGENNLPKLSLNGFTPPSKSELQNSGFDPSKIISNILQSPDEFSPNDVQHSSTLRESPSSYHSIVNVIEINEALNDPVVHNNVHNSLIAQSVASTTEMATQPVPPLSSIIEQSDDSQPSEIHNSQTNIPNVQSNLQSGDSNTERTTPLAAPITEAMESSNHAREGESNDSQSRCIRGFKIKQTRSNNPESILKGIKDKKILFTDNGNIISDIKIIEKHLLLNPNVKISSISQAEFSQLLESH